MSQATAKITGKGQVQIPVQIRRAIGAEIGDNIIFTALADETAILKVIKKKSLSDLGGSLKSEVAFINLEDEASRTKELWVNKRIGEKL